MTVLLQFSGAAIELQGFTLEIGDLQIRPGITLITGPNGAGKSTLLRTIMGLHRLSRGLRESSDSLRFGYVPQNYRESMIPWLSAWQNLNLIGRLSRENLRWLFSIGFSATDLRKYPGRLSGGQCQRLAIAREWASQPDLLVLDEPFSGLDTRSTTQAAKLLSNFDHANRRAIALTTHIKAEALSSTAVTSRITIERCHDQLAILRHSE